MGVRAWWMTADGEVGRQHPMERHAMGAVETCSCGKAAGTPRWEPDGPEWTRLDATITEHRGQPGALIPVLHRAQQLFGYLPTEVQERVAVGLGLPVSEVYGVVTFYSYFTTVPRGRRIVRVCLGTACYVRGSWRILEQVKRELGVTSVPGTTEDREFSVETVRCVGACGLAPVMMVDDDIYRRVKPRKVAEVLARYREASVAQS
jgi:NADH:ubiquinone oxidoreductase subunit E